MIVGYLPYSDDKIRSADLSSLKIISVWSSALADGRTTPRRGRSTGSDASKVYALDASNGTAKLPATPTPSVVGANLLRARTRHFGYGDFPGR